MSKRTIICFDFETTHKDPDSEYCDIVEIGAVAMHSKTLKPIPGEEFYVDVRPPSIDDPDFYEKRRDTIDWHCGLKPGRTPESMIEKWKQGTPEKDALKMFLDFCKNFKWGRSFDTAPVAGGNNIMGYDIPILERLCKKHKLRYPFFKRDKWDIQQMCLYTLAFSLDPPRSYSMDNLRVYFGMSGEHGHNALFDSQQEAQVIQLLGGKLKTFSRNFCARGALQEY
jgi:DNA polymerase III epsilon subunit-like protein